MVGLPVVTRLSLGRVEAKRMCIQADSRFGSFPSASITWLQSSMLNQVDWCSPVGPGWDLSVVFSVFPGAVCELLNDASGHQATGSFLMYSTSLSNEILS